MYRSLAGRFRGSSGAPLCLSPLGRLGRWRVDRVGVEDRVGVRSKVESNPASARLRSLVDFQFSTRPHPLPVDASPYPKDRRCEP
jgi:hypothetical protein